MKKTKICLNAMVANEARTITRMLDSCYKYIDYWVIQDNGSTDGTQDIIRNYFAEKGIPGFLYETEWLYPGFNRDHTLQTCLKADHGCDWILRMDADEQLLVEDDFDWSLLDDTSIESFNVIVHSFGSRYFRTWLWNAKLPWFFAHDKRHETIHLPEVGEDFQRIVLSEKFRHIVTNDGQTWFAPRKFLKDALELEIDKVVGNTILEDGYHFWYVAKSYSDCYQKSDDFPLGRDHSLEYARRAIFYFDQWLKRFHNYPLNKNDIRPDEMAYMGLLLKGEILNYMGDKQSAEVAFTDAALYAKNRNEHLMALAFLYESQKRWDDMMRIINVALLPERKNPFPQECFLIEDRAYHDTGTLWVELKERTMKRLTEPVISNDSLDFDFE